jgi:hypothetical protein
MALRCPAPVSEACLALGLAAALAAGGALRAAPQTPVQAAPLTIVVIAGEDAVNIIQQKTAIAPVVEIRDRNDLPVSGASVTFTINGGNASFAGGAQTVTVTTNAAGRAASIAMNPISPGSVQINVSAAAQGQTATAVITQTNYLTVAAATAAGATIAGTAAAAAGAGGASAGGGLSGVAIAGIVGGAAAGGLVAAKAAGALGGETRPCNLNVTPTSIRLSGQGDSASIEIREIFDECEPPDWQATSTVPWLTFTNGVSTLAGRGSTVISVTAPPNDFGAPPRTATVTVAGQAITVSQNARCTLSVSPTQARVPQSGGTVTFTVTLLPAGCDQAEWQVTASAAAMNAGVVISPLSGNGNGVITAIVPPSDSPVLRGLSFSISTPGQGVAVLINQEG